MVKSAQVKLYGTGAYLLSLLSVDGNGVRPSSLSTAVIVPLCLPLTLHVTI